MRPSSPRSFLSAGRYRNMPAAAGARRTRPAGASAPSSVVIGAPGGKDMRPRSAIWVLLLALPMIPGAPAPAADSTGLVHVVIRTEKGDIEVELDAAKAPVTVANFLRYVDGRFYDGGRFHRTVTPDNQPDNKVKIEVIQAGINPDRAKDEFAPIKLERTRDTKLAHKEDRKRV